MMFPIVMECCDTLKQVLKPSADLNDIIEAKTFFAKYTMDVIAKCAFGLDISCQLNETNEFMRVGKRLAKPTFYENMVVLITMASPGLRNFFKV